MEGLGAIFPFKSIAHFRIQICPSNGKTRLCALHLFGVGFIETVVGFIFQSTHLLPILCVNMSMWTYVIHLLCFCSLLTLTTSNRRCIKDRALEKLVHSNGTRTMVFIYYHNDHTKAIAERYAYCKDWIFPVFLYPSKYMESQVYGDLFRPNVTGWIYSHPPVDFIITGEPHGCACVCVLRGRCC